MKSNCNFIKLVGKIGMITFLCKFISIFIKTLFEKKCSLIYSAVQNLPIYGLHIYAENPYMTGIYAYHVWLPYMTFSQGAHRPENEYLNYSKAWRKIPRCQFFSKSLIVCSIALFTKSINQFILNETTFF